MLRHDPVFRSGSGGKRRSGMLARRTDRKSTRLNSSHSQISYAVFCLKKKKKYKAHTADQQHRTAVSTLEIYLPISALRRAYLLVSTTLPWLDQFPNSVQTSAVTTTTG